jgi:ABC-type polysaccharide/polyol phosphate transport system ATPase subunit
MASISVRGLGVRFLFDGQRDVVTPMRAKLALRTSEVWGLRDLSLEVGPGEAVALIGPTGSGKTTLLRVLAGVLPVDAGEMRVEGKRGSMLSIDAGLLPNLIGRENAALLAVLGGTPRAQAKARLDVMRERSGLGDSFELPASSYSQGMRARLAFTAATVCDPDLILLDEVHEAFDHAFREVLEATVRRLLARGGIVVAAGHDHELLSRLCSRALLLSNGQIAEDGPFGQVRERYLGRDAGAAQQVEAVAR